MFWSTDCKYMKIMYVHCGEETNIRDPRSPGHYWTSSWNKTWKNLRPVRDLNPWPLRYRCSALPTEPTSQLGADDYVGVVSFFFVGKDQLSRKLYQKIAPYCDILQRLCILRRFEGESESLVSVESKVIVYSGFK